MQAVMDTYAGGIGAHYKFTVQSLQTADAKISALQEQARALSASEPQELVYILELLERLTLCRSVIAHLGARKETRWHSFAEFDDYPAESEKCNLYVNSRMENGKLRLLFRPLVKEGKTYEH